MKSVRSFSRKLVDKTLLKYFLSYFSLFGLLILGFFFIIRSHLTTLYYEQLAERAQEHLNSIMETFSDEIVSLTTITNSLENNINVIASRYNDTGYNSYLAYQELLKYTTGRYFIESIVYLDKKNDICVSTSPYVNVSYHDGVFSLLNDSVLLFETDRYLSSTKSQLLFLTDGLSEYFIFLPYSTDYSNHLFFYILSTNEIAQLCKSISSEEMPAVALVDREERVVAGTNGSLLHSDSADRLNMFLDDTGSSLLVSQRDLHGYNMEAVISADVLLDRINQAFLPIYLLVLLLGTTGILMILSSMRKTYFPLRKITQKLVAAPDPDLEYLDQLEQVFTETAEQNRQLAEKLAKSRLSMQKSILDSIVSSTQGEDVGLQPDLEQFFSMEPDNFIFAVRMQSPGSASEFPCKKIVRYFRDMLLETPSCVVLDLMGNTAVLLLNYLGPEPHKDEVLRFLLSDPYRERRYLSAISNGSLSPMDIPALYEHTLQASSLWAGTPVAFYQDTDFPIPPKDMLSYPYNTISSLSVALLSVALKEKNFAEASGYIKSLFQIIDSPDDSEDDLPLFFIRCILIDMLSAFMNAMNHAQIKFKTYDELYFETLQYCRSCPYTEKREAIHTNIRKLLALYESCLEQRSSIAWAISTRPASAGSSSSPPDSHPPSTEASGMANNSGAMPLRRDVPGL